MKLFKPLHRTLYTCFLLVVAHSIVFTKTFDEKMKPGLRESGTYRAWVYFSDKEASKKSVAVSPEALHRRTKLNFKNYEISYLDKEISDNYINQLEETGVKLLHESRWLNATSVLGTLKQLETIGALSFVRKVEPVRQYKRPRERTDRGVSRIAVTDSTVYGVSWTQLNMLRIPEVHELGFKGDGIRVLVLDTGFDLTHNVFSVLNVVAEYDFLNSDTITADQTQSEENSGQDRHGTIVLSVLAANLPGQMLGAAYEAEYLLAKTEDVSDEYVGEEDNFVAGLEWGEINGADIMTASLGYIDWYEPSDLDGQTAITTKAVNIATSLGMVCVVAAGNEGQGGILAPADAFDVISVGAVSSSGIIASFSSVGPTYDGRIKPEVCAMGYQTWAARPGTNDFSRYSGTSIATPIISGALSLVIQANPNMNVEAVRSVLLQNSTRAESPDNTYGWGLPDIYVAAGLKLPDHFTDAALVVPNPVLDNKNNKIDLWFYTEDNGKGAVQIYTVTGSLVSTKSVRLHIGLNSIEISIAGLSSGIYLARIISENDTGTEEQIGFSKFTVIK